MEYYKKVHLLIM